MPLPDVYGLCVHQPDVHDNVGCVVATAGCRSKVYGRVHFGAWALVPLQNAGAKCARRLRFVCRCKVQVFVPDSDVHGSVRGGGFVGAAARCRCKASLSPMVVLNAGLRFYLVSLFRFHSQAGFTVGSSGHSCSSPLALNSSLAPSPLSTLPGRANRPCASFDPRPKGPNGKRRKK